MDDDTPLHLAWLLLHDRDFAEEVAPAIQLEDYPQGALRGLVMLAQDQNVRYRQPTTLQALEAALTGGWPAERYGTTPEAMLEIYGRLDDFEVEDEARDRIAELCHAWLRTRHMGRAVDEAGIALERGQPDAARDALDQARREYQPPEPALTLGDVGLLYQESPNGAVPTGLGFVDKAWHGGLRPHELGVLVSSTNLGKSQSLCFFALQAYLSGRSALYYTSELTPKQILSRIVSGILERSFDQISETEAVRMIPYIQQQRQLPGWIQIKGVREGMTVEDLRLDLEELGRDGKKPDVVLLDSADDLTPSHRGREDWLNQADIYSSLRRLCVQHGYAIWTTTQANRDAVERARISLKHMGRSFTKAQRAHFVLGLAQTDEQRKDPLGPLLSVFVLKDSEWGSPGLWKEMHVTFGQGAGYPGFTTID